MTLYTFYGIMIPFLGTLLGSACVFFMKKGMGDRLQRALSGFAAGVVADVRRSSPFDYAIVVPTAKNDILSAITSVGL